MTQPTLPGMTDEELILFVEWQGGDAAVLAHLFTDQVESEPEEDREPEPETWWIPGYAPADYTDENPYVDDYDRWQDAISDYEDDLR